jgi:DNA-binding NarL/FixJ family response regulator
MNPIKVTLFEDNSALREAMFFVINGSPGFTCLAAFEDANNIIEKIKINTPDVILMDIDMPGITGIEATALLRANQIEIPILIQTVFEADEKVFQAICAGANGYVLKQTSPSRLLECLKECVEGGSPMTPLIASKVLKLFREKNTWPAKSEAVELSNREKEILALLTEGLSYKMIGDKCSISYETVHSHIKKIYKKLHVNSVAEAISKALKQGLV